MMNETTRKISVENYPEHLNPFDDNYNALEIESANDQHKYNTWGSSRGKQVSSGMSLTMARASRKNSLLDKPWAALNISPGSKLGRRLSILKSTVERFTPKKLTSRGDKNRQGMMRSNSLHEDLHFKIVSPKVREKLRQQAIPALSRQQQTEEPKGPSDETPEPPPRNSRLPLSLEDDAEVGVTDKADIQAQDTPLSPEDHTTFGARRKSRKKRPPPPPPPIMSPGTLDISTLPNGKERSEDCDSLASSITKDLEKNACGEDNDSLTEFEFDHNELKHIVTS